ncbi:uncharacterized protein ACB058_010890 [Synchiropus picturatus]
MVITSGLSVSTSVIHHSASLLIVSQSSTAPRYTMRTLLESSWIKFGPAGREDLDWSPGPSAMPSTNQLTTGQHSSDDGIFTSASITYITIATASVLLVLSLLGFTVWQRRRHLGCRGKFGLANAIALEDLHHPERNCELLSSTQRNQDKVPRCSSEQDCSDGVFLMVYLPSPYKHTLTRIARVASTSSSKELLPPSPELETSIMDNEDDGHRKKEGLMRH